jgi:hypothetical protein
MSVPFIILIIFFQLGGNPSTPLQTQCAQTRHTNPPRPAAADPPHKPAQTRQQKPTQKEEKNARGGLLAKQTNKQTNTQMALFICMDMRCYASRQARQSFKTA